MDEPLIVGRQRNDRRAADNEQRAFADMPTSPTGTRPAQDPTSAQGRARSSLNNPGQLVFGRVVDVVAYARTYKVQCERGIGTVRACDAGQTGFGVAGPRQLNTYPVGTAVLMLYHPQGLFGVIVCSVPDWAFDPRHASSDAVVQGSNVGLQVDAVHQHPFATADDGGVIDFSAGRPIDSLTNEWGAIAETGVRVFLDSFMAQVAVDEQTGLFAFYEDQLARLSGHNLQVRSAGRDREDLDDEGEFSSVEGATPYPWEALGLYAASGVAHVENTADQTQGTSGSDRARYEPAFDDQLGLHRSREFRGYLGQGGKRVQGTHVPTSGVHRHASPGTSLVGLFEENVGLDGSLAARSSHSVVLAKLPLVPSPKRRARPENPSADNPANYKAAGRYGAGAAHLVASAPSNANANPHMVEPAALMDQLAYAFNWKGLHPFHYHALDWYLPQEKELPQYPTVQAAVVPFLDLQSNMNFLPQAPEFTVKVDDRYGLAKYYANAATIALLPNGGISLVDGWGSELRLAGGNVYEHAAGDLIKTCGRTAWTMAGWDAVVKANNSVEVVANWSDVRVKAQSKVLITGGVDGCGGVLVESRGTGAAFSQDLANEDVLSGVLIKAKSSAIVLAGKDVELTTRYWGGTLGRIHLDTEAGTVIVRAKQVHRHLGEGAIDFLPGGKSNEFWGASARLSTQLLLESDVLVEGTAGFLGNVAVWGDILGDTWLTNSGAAPTPPTRNLSAVRTASLASLTWFKDNTDVEKLEFYFRTPTLAKTVGLILHEPAWHQMVRYSPVVMPKWQEKTVTCEFGRGETGAFPGKSVWFTDSAYARQPLNLYDAANRAANDRGASYETASLGTTSFVNLENTWPVVRNP